MPKYLKMSKVFTILFKTLKEVFLDNFLDAYKESLLV